METGILDQGECLRATQARLLRHGKNNSWIEVTLQEGKNREIRRMAEQLGFATLRLIRISVGGLQLGMLPKGQARPLLAEEVQSLAQLGIQKLK